MGPQGHPHSDSSFHKAIDFVITAACFLTLIAVGAFSQQLQLHNPAQLKAETQREISVHVLLWSKDQHFVYVERQSFEYTRRDKVTPC